MQNTLIDNSQDLKLVDFLKEILTSTDYTELSIATGYWDLPGTRLLYEELKAFLDRGGKFRLLIGQEPTLRTYQMNNAVEPDEIFPDFYIKRDIQQLSEEFQPVVKLLMDYALPDDEPNSQIQIRIFGQNQTPKRFLHAKCYIAKGTTGKAIGIVGSSNFTQKGLEENAELNYLESTYLTVTGISDTPKCKSHIVWFNECWEDAEPWTGRFLKDIVLPSPIGTKVEEERQEAQRETLTPYELYIKYLQTEFGEIVDGKADTELRSYLPANYNPLEYQLDAVKQCFNIMKHYGGFILGDVVGLGKTVVGLLLVKRFLNYPGDHPARVLIVTPPPIKSAWVRTIEDFDRNRTDKLAPYIDFITTGSIGKILDDDDDSEQEDVGNDFEEKPTGQYGLILIDESHNFRNSSTNKYRDLDELIGSTTPTPYIGLLSATPQNNTPEDLKNQIYLFERNPNNSRFPNVEGGKLDSFFSQMKKRFYLVRNLPDRKTQKAEIQAIAEEIRRRVLNDIVVRRTRTDIKKNYAKDSEQLRFPAVKGPYKLEYQLDDEQCQLFYDSLVAICGADDGEIFDPQKHIGYYRYAAIMHFKDPRNRQLYEYRNLTVDSITIRLQHIMQIMLVKRLESSFGAFKESLQNLRDYTRNMIQMLDNDCVFICPDIDVNLEFKNAEGIFKVAIENLRKKIKKKGGKNCEYHRNAFLPNYRQLLQQDYDIISKLCDRWGKIDIDPKLDAFRDALNEQLFSPEINNPSGFDKPRLVIFTEAKATLRSLCKAIEKKGHKVLCVSADNRDDLQATITANFDANVKEEDRRDDYDVLVTTEVLAEGVNLHRANVILNYDAPWNSTRLMQRIGRINRIGSREAFIHIFNFFPTPEGNQAIRLIEKSYAKLQAFHVMFGGDNKVFSDSEELTEVDLTHIVDGDASPDGEYIQELKVWRESHPERYVFLETMPLEKVGGTIVGSTTGDTLVGMTLEKSKDKRLVCATVPYDGPGTIIQRNAILEWLKCPEDAQFDSTPRNDLEDIFQRAVDAFNQHLVHHLSSADTKPKQTQALGIIYDLIKSPNTSNEAKKLLRQIDKAVRNKNNYAIQKILEYPSQSGSIFGTEFDLDQWVSVIAGQVAAKAEEKNGAPVVAIYEMK